MYPMLFSIAKLIIRCKEDEMTFETYVKDPKAVLDYAFDWTDWLADGETISSYVVEVETGLTEDSNGVLLGVVTVWLSGGTAGETYKVACTITTSEGRIDERTIEIDVQNR